MSDTPNNTNTSSQLANHTKETRELMTTPNADQFLMSGSSKAAKFTNTGDQMNGRIVDPPEVMQQTEFGTGKPRFWDDGKPMLQLRVILATDFLDPADPDDDGKRALYVKGQMQKAIKEAVRAAGARGLEAGGHLKVTYTGDGEAKRGFNPPKLYAAEYTAPNPLDEVADPSTTTTATTVNGSDEQVPAGVDPGMWAGLDTEQRATVTAAMAAKK